MIFSIENSSYRYSKNLKYFFLVLGEQQTDNDNDGVIESERKLSIIFNNSKIKSCQILH